MIITERTPLSLLVDLGVGIRALQNLHAAGVITVGDYLRTENRVLRAVPLMGDTKIGHLDRYLAGLGFDTKARWWLQYRQFDALYVYRHRRSGVQSFYHLVTVAKAADKAPFGLCGYGLYDPHTSFAVPADRTFCHRCALIIEWEKARRG